MSTPLIVGDGVNLVDDHSPDMPKVLARFSRRQQDVERLRRSHKNVRRVAQHRGALLGQRVAGAHSGTNLRREIPLSQCKLLNLAKRLVEILLNIVGERLQRRDVHHLRARCEVALDRAAKKLVDTDQKGCQSLAGSGRRRDQRRLTGKYRRPAVLLGLSGRAEFLQEPLRRYRMRPAKTSRNGEAREYVRRSDQHS